MFSRGLGNSPWGPLAPGGKRRSSLSPLQEGRRAVCRGNGNWFSRATCSSMAFLYPVWQGSRATRPQQPLDGVERRMLQREKRPAAGRLVPSPLCAGLQLSGKPNWENLKQGWQPRMQWGKPREEAASLVSADLGTQQLLMDGVRPGQAPWEPQAIHYRPPGPHTASSRLGINLCLGSQRARGETAPYEKCLCPGSSYKAREEGKKGVPQRGRNPKCNLVSGHCSVWTPFSLSPWRSRFVEACNLEDKRLLPLLGSWTDPDVSQNHHLWNPLQPFMRE